MSEPCSPCYICGGPITELALDPRDMKTRPCATCNNVIAETAGLDEDDDFVVYLDSDLSDFSEFFDYENEDYD